MSSFQTNEPDHRNSLEIVDAGILFTGTDITLIYNPTTGVFQVRRGAITHVDTITEITAVSNEGYTYTITRGRDGDCKVKNGAGTIIGIKRTITIETRNGSTFRITRYANGGTSSISCDSPQKYVLVSATRRKRSDISGHRAREKINVPKNSYERNNMSFFPTPSPNNQEVVDVTTSYYTGPDFILTRYPRPYEGFGVNRGRILSVETVTTIRVEASNGEIFTITRDENGGKHDIGQTTAELEQGAAKKGNMTCVSGYDDASNDPGNAESNFDYNGVQYTFLIEECFHFYTENALSYRKAGCPGDSETLDLCRQD
ncbi:unnamed protein product [Porites evermanni]|uniref:Uncharacterized protein n=1 Tax=Porites evermanni TaxID=104178 RepID=A0ABN8M920_9CNID|nr:unnamed protein product [Porites evermanni]